MYIKREVSTEGMVIGRASAGEGSARVLLYTRQLGLVVALAKSAREERSKLRPHLQVGTSGIFTLVKGKDVWRVTGATATKNAHFALSGNVAGQQALARVLGSMRQFVRGEGADPYLFSVLSGFFESLYRTDTARIAAAEGLAVLRILAALGYVGENELTKEFLPAHYDEAVLTHADAKRVPLIRTINEAITASGL